MVLKYFIKSYCRILLLTKQRQNEVLVPFFIVTQTYTKLCTSQHSVVFLHTNKTWIALAGPRTGPEIQTGPDRTDWTRHQTRPDLTRPTGMDRSSPDQTRLDPSFWGAVFLMVVVVEHHDG